MNTTYRKISSKDLKNEGRIIDGERHIPEGIYTTYDPQINNSTKEKVKKDLK